MYARFAICSVMALLAYTAAALGQAAPDQLPAVASEVSAHQTAEATVEPKPEATDAKSTEETKLAALEKSVGEISKKLTVVTADEQYKLILGGVISADFYYNHARPVAPGIPFLLTPRSPFGFNQDTFDANARQSTLFGMVAGPEVCGFKSGGLVAVCFFNDALIVDRYGVLPLQAWGELKNDNWRFSAGLQFDVFNPINPTVLPFSYLGGSGNAGAGFPGQVRAERYFHPADDAQLTVTVALSEPLSTTINDSFRISEDNGFPNFETRTSIACGPLQGEGPSAKRTFEAGVSGLAGQIRTTKSATRIVNDVWGLGSDIRYAITPCFGFQGEAFMGQTLGNYTAGILQNYNLQTFDGVHAAGGWVELYYFICPDKLHTHVGYGIDDPLDSDLAPGQPVRNETYFANLIWDPTRHLRFGTELTYRRTAYTLFHNNDGVGIQFQTQLRF